MKTSRFLVALLALTAVSGSTACRPKEEETGTITAQQATKAQEELPPAVRAQLDSANEAFRAGDHKTALEHYTKARDLKSDVAAAWFGIYMAQHALGNEDSAKAALTEAQKISPGATLIQSTGRDTVR
jgi:tetratricopeptide (TPR) repeat protein